MDKEYLLTYQNAEGKFDFEWFDTEDEIIDRVEELKDDVTEIEALHVRVLKKLV